MINTAKALLTSDELKTNRYNLILKQFDEHFTQTGKITLDDSFENLVTQIKKNEPSESFAKDYLLLAETFYKQADQFRANQLKNGN